MSDTLILSSFPPHPIQYTTAALLFMYYSS